MRFAIQSKVRGLLFVAVGASLALAAFVLLKEDLWPAQRPSPNAVAWFTYPEQIDRSILSKLRIVINKQDVFSKAVSVIAGSDVPFEVEAEFRDPQTPTSVHRFFVAHRPIIDGRADWSQVLLLREWRYYLESPDRPPLKIDLPPGDYELRAYLRVDDAVDVDPQLKVYYLGEGRLSVLDGASAES